MKKFSKVDSWRLSRRFRGVTTQGETLEEAETNAAEAIMLYLESLAAHGEPIPA
jgi:predicted RNase H-like HicB family nuclease